MLKLLYYMKTYQNINLSIVGIYYENSFLGCELNSAVKQFSTKSITSIKNPSCKTFFFKIKNIKLIVTEVYFESQSKICFWEVQLSCLKISGMPLRK